jgi:hypothetical protein
MVSGRRQFTSRAVFALAGAGLLSGCAFHPDWPDGPIETEQAGEAMSRRAFRLDGAKAANYWQRLNDGRVVELAFDTNADGQPDEVVDLRGEHADWPQFIIVLDGVPFDVVEAMYREGHFRLFAPPTRVVSVFPAMTDVALSRIFHTPPCVAVEAQYFDRDKNAVSNANDVYLSGENAPWTKAVDYSAPQDIAVKAYLDPWAAFSAELRAMDQLFRAVAPAISRCRHGLIARATRGPRHPKQARAVAYSVGTAGIGTRQGEAGIRRHLAEVEKLCERITYERRGRVRFSIMADHGHGLRACRRITLDGVLEDTSRPDVHRDKGAEDAAFHVAKSIRQPSDVVIVSYGLVTCAELYTDRPGEVAAALVRHPDVDLAVFREGDRVVVQNATARAAIRRGPGGYVYEGLNNAGARIPSRTCLPHGRGSELGQPLPDGRGSESGQPLPHGRGSDLSGDPLELGPIIERLRAEGQVGEDGVIADRPLLEATATHKYPDALQRLWSCFDGEVRRPADVIVSLKPDACHGSAFFHFFVAPVASTHGSLEYLSSTTFLLTNATTEPLPAVLRPEDVMGVLHVELGG